MDVREQVDLDYARAHRRALVGRFLAWLRRRCAALRAFEEARREVGAENRRRLGRRTVRVDRVVGSVGRWREFDGGFMPARASAGRWKRVDLAFRTGLDLPPDRKSTRLNSSHANISYAVFCLKKKKKNKKTTKSDY